MQLKKLASLNDPALSKRRTGQLMLIFAAFPDYKSGPRAPEQRLPLMVWTNGSTALDTPEFRKQMLSVGSLTQCWDAARNIRSFDAINSQLHSWKTRTDMQIPSLESRIIKKVR